MVFKATGLMRDSYLLKRAHIDVSRMRPEEVRRGAVLLRRITLAPPNDDGAEHAEALVAWKAFREGHRLNR
jgi:hypothetical protein